MTMLYEVYDGLYVNLTNRCSCRCTFCLRSQGEGVCGSDSLWLEREPTFEEVRDEFAKFDMSRYDEVVFCGFGEPTEAWEVLKQVAAYVKETYGLPVRVNTNGQGSLINGRDIAPEFAGLVDAVSISLNTPNPVRYAELTRSRFGTEAFPAMLDFAREVRRYVPDVTMTTVETTLTPEEEAACRAICDELGVTYRIRRWVEQGKITK
ncbi:radical SAM protein [Enterorhabdus mucosicola]|uniref:Radical SAM protein n=2 Tax=Adlercreutzia mucosicola TaxID=580026 RepID=A0A6N8JR53_9ACTN|nr:radical SAM protein [Adlercreutzia mucosicola]